MERLSHLIWRKRARCLCSILDQPLPLHSIQLRAQAAWGWSHWFTSNVICAAEGREIRARRVKLVWLYGRVPGSYPEVSEQHGRELRRIVGSTVAPRKRKLVRA